MPARRHAGDSRIRTGGARGASESCGSSRETQTKVLLAERRKVPPVKSYGSAGRIALPDECGGRSWSNWNMRQTGKSALTRRGMLTGTAVVGVGTAAVPGLAADRPMISAGRITGCENAGMAASGMSGPPRHASRLRPRRAMQTAEGHGGRPLIHLHRHDDCPEHCRGVSWARR